MAQTATHSQPFRVSVGQLVSSAFTWGAACITAWIAASTGAKASLVRAQPVTILAALTGRFHRPARHSASYDSCSP